MEIASGLSALKTAADLARALRDAAKAGSLKSDEFAGRIAEVYDYISDSKEAVLDAQETISQLREENERLETKLAETVEAEPCPSCHKKGWHVESSQPDPTFGDLGAARRVYRCRFCQFSESKITK
jgi:DNA repair exonuclease SbcCD ATPase subunit